MLQRDQFDLTSAQTDPAGQFAWLTQTLQNARQAGEKVWLISHVPPGFHEKFGIGNLWTNFTPPYLAAISGFSDVIVAQIYGHDHTDSFRFYFDTPLATVPSSYMLLAPSITPWRSPYYPQGPNNPGVRLISYDESSFDLLDYTQHWTNLSSDIQANGIVWQPLYSFVETYGAASPLNAQNLYNVYLSMLANDTLFQVYANFMSVNYPSGACTIGLHCGRCWRSVCASSPWADLTHAAVRTCAHFLSLCVLLAVQATVAALAVRTFYAR